MRLFGLNKTGGDIWFTVLLTHELTDGVPEPRLYVFATSKQLRADFPVKGQLLHSGPMKTGTFFQLEGLPDPPKPPRRLYDGTLGDIIIRQKIIGDGQQRILLIFITAPGEKSGSTEAAPAPHPNGMPNAIIVRNTLGETVFVTFFKGDMETGSPGEEAIRTLMLLVSEDEPPPEAVAGEHYLRHKRLKPGETLILKRLPMFDSFGILVEDHICDSTEQTSETPFGSTLAIDLIPNR